ncbi:amidohydrolase family protein [Formosa undariae]|uniref:Amidohydrolase family protein n=1 Tax=Formosa undariae TaxID=1325436 RepID=A0ABV5EY62_9FLAO
MTYKYLLIFLFLSFAISLNAQTYITNVTVADVEKQVLIPNQTLVITNDLISDIKKSTKVEIPADAKVIDGSGKYVFPGLTDAHIHFFQSGGLYTRPDAIDLRSERPYDLEIDYAHKNMEVVLHRYLQNGITNVIDLGATYNLLKQKDAYKNIANLPSVYMSGPLLTTYQPDAYNDLENDAPFTLVKTVEDGINMVRAQLPHHPDLIKIWYIVGRDGLSLEESAQKSLPLVKAIINEAHRNNLKVAVHATQRITAQLAVEHGCDFLVHSVADELVTDDFIQLLKKNKTILSPTLLVRDGYVNTYSQSTETSIHELQKADAYQLGTLQDLKHVPDTVLVSKYKKRTTSEASIRNLDKRTSIMMTNLKLLSDAGVLIATGTDAGNIGTLHASSYLAEVQAMYKSGMSTWDIMTASTVNGAKVLGKAHEFGTVSKGKKANLILLDANPIEDINNITALNKVINNGMVLNPNDILKDTASDLVQRQLNGYNLRNIEAFLEPYADDVEVYTNMDQLQYKGKATMRAKYSKLFDNTPNLHCELTSRFVQGNKIIDNERVQFGDKTIEASVIYQIENNKIKKVFFMKSE